MPGKDRASPDEALLFIDNVRERLTVVGLEPDEYAQMLKDAAISGVMGGGIYDALIGNCAVKARADAMYTWNLKHFTRLDPKFAARVKTP